MATPNYSYEKRQRELAKKRKAEEKAQEKRLRKLHPQGGGDAAPDEHGAPAEGAEPAAPAAPAA